MVNGQSSIVLLEKAFEISDLENKQLIIAATADKTLNEEIYRTAKEKNILINVADTPELCDFYLGSIVTKGGTGGAAGIFPNVCSINAMVSCGLISPTNAIVARLGP